MLSALIYCYFLQPKLDISSSVHDLGMSLQAPAGAAVKPGILGKLWSVTEMARKANHAVRLSYILICMCTS